MEIQYRKIGDFVLAVVFLITTVSCVSTKSLTIEIPHRGKNELPATIQSLTLINRTVDEGYTDLESDSLQKIFYKQNFNYDTIINDIQAVDTTIKALGELLFESGRYDFVIPEDRFLKSERNTFLSIEMPWKEVEKLCKTYQTDALLSLDYFKTNVSTNYSKDSFYNPSSDSFSAESYAKMSIYYEALFRIYEPVQEKVLVREFLRDTIIWEDADRSTSDLFRRFTPIKTALSEAGIAIALDFSDRISTVWAENKRQYFIKGDTDLKHAAQLVEIGEWEKAKTLWKATAEKSKSKSVKSKAEFNIALAFELQGSINDAIKWALVSYETMYRQITYDYLETLNRRKNKLKSQ